MASSPRTADSSNIAGSSETIGVATQPGRRFAPAWLVRTRQRHARTLAKTFGYRLLMLAITIGVALAVTGDLTTAFNIGLVANVIKTGTYYGYERLWARVSWGLDST